MNVLESLDVNTVRQELRYASHACQQRGLYYSAKFTAELLNQLTNNNNLNTTHNLSSDNNNDNNNSFFLQQQDQSSIAQSIDISTLNDSYILGKTYFDLREYDRASHALINSSPKNQANLFLKNYCKYLAGEKRKNEAIPVKQMKLEKNNPNPIPNLPINPNLNTQKQTQNNNVINQEIQAIIAEYETIITNYNTSHPNSQSQSNFPLDGFNYYLLGVCYKATDQKEKCVETLLLSVQLFPLNWSAWLLLTSLISDRAQLVQLRLPSRPHFIHHFFYAAALLELHENSANEVISILDRLADQFPDSTHILVQTALAHYNRREFDEASELFEAIRLVDPYRLENLDIYSNILYVKENKSELALLAQNSARINKYSVESAVIIGNYYSLKGEHEQAINYFKRALAIDPYYLSAYTLMGHEYIEVRNTSAAIECYRSAISINEKDYRAWYGIGQTYEILQINTYSLYYFKRAALLRPFDSRMWCAMAESYEKLNQIQQAIKCYLRAEANQISDNNKTQANTTLQATASNKLAKLYQKQGDLLTAAKYYKKLLNLQRQNVEENFEEKRNNSMNESVRSDLNTPDNSEVSPETIDALQFLAEYTKNSHDFELSEKYCNRLIEIGGQAKDTAKALLIEIKHLKSYANSQSGKAQQQQHHNSSSLLTTPQISQQHHYNTRSSGNSFFSTPNS